MDNVYLNITINEPGRASFSSNRAGNILNRVGDYRCGVARFTVPVSNIPIRHEQDFLDGFSVSVSVGGVSFTEAVTKADVDNGGAYIESFADITRAINAAYARAFANLKVALPLLTATEPPVVTFFEASALFFVKVQLAYYTDNIDIWCNADMWRYLKFPSKKTVGGVNDRQITYYDNGVNTDLALGYTFFYQPFKTSSLFSDLKDIFFETSRIPVFGELVAGQEKITKDILTDFDPLQQAIGDSTRLSFFPQGPLRFYNMQGAAPLRDIDLRVMYSTTTQPEALPLIIDAGEFVNIKLQFERIK